MSRRCLILIWRCRPCEVAGAVGAAVGSVRQRVMITVTQPTEGKFRVHLPQGPADFGIMDEALDKARAAATQLATSRALSAGATAVTIEMTEDMLVPLASNKDMFSKPLYRHPQ